MTLQTTVEPAAQPGALVQAEIRPVGAGEVWVTLHPIAERDRPLWEMAFKSLPSVWSLLPAPPSNLDPTGPTQMIALAVGSMAAFLRDLRGRAIVPSSEAYSAATGAVQCRLITPRPPAPPPPVAATPPVAPATTAIRDAFPRERLLANDFQYNGGASSADAETQPTFSERHARDEEAAPRQHRLPLGGRLRWSNHTTG